MSRRSPPRIAASPALRPEKLPMTVTRNSLASDMATYVGSRVRCQVRCRRDPYRDCADESNVSRRRRATATFHSRTSMREPTAPTAPGETLLVDAHVHLYRCFGTERFFDCALANVRAGAAAVGGSARVLGCLLFTETAADHAFAELAGAERPAERWRFLPTAEAGALFAERTDGARLLVMAGRQIRTREDLEVLALGTTKTYADGLPFLETLETALETAGAAVVPWGFGKWWFRRGGLVRRALGTVTDPHFFLGDNGGRLAGTPRPRLFREAEARGCRVLPGSDPLPFPGQERRVASYGFLLEGPLDGGRPGSSLLARCSANPESPR